MTKPGMSNAGVGRALFATRLGLSIQAGWMCLKFGALPAFAVPLMIWLYLVSPTNWDLVRMGPLAAMSGRTAPHRWIVRDAGGAEQRVTVYLADGTPAQWLTGEQALRAVALPRAEAVAGFKLALLASLTCSGLAAFGVLHLLQRLGAASQKDQRLRGAQDLVAPAELNCQVQRNGASHYKLAGVCLPEHAPMAGILIEGAQGSGKSIAFNDLMCQVFARKRKCIVFDQSGEYFRAYFRPGKDLFFNPALTGSVPWSIFSELRKTYNADTMAQAFLPPKASGTAAGSNVFFEDAARAVFSALLLRLFEAGATNTADIAHAILRMPADQMDFLIRNTVASSAIGGDSKTQRQGVISSISIYLNGLAAVQAGNWSVRRFIETDDDARLFLLGTNETKAMFAPLYRLVLSVAFSAIAARGQVVHKDRYWFFLDETPAIGDIRLDEVLAELRKFGVCVVSGLQSHTQQEAAIGDKRAGTVSNCFNTALLLRANDSKAQERAALRLGKMEMETVGRNQALAVAEWRDGAGLNMSERDKWLVMPSDFGDVAPCVGWIKLAGDFPAAKVDYRSWLERGLWGARVDAFRPVQPLPPADPGFNPRRIESVNALESVSEAFEQHAATQNAPGKGVPSNESPNPEAPNPEAVGPPPTSRTASAVGAPRGRTPGSPGQGGAAAQALQPVQPPTQGQLPIFTRDNPARGSEPPERPAKQVPAAALHPSRQAPDMLGVQQPLQGETRHWEQGQPAPAQGRGPEREIER